MRRSQGSSTREEFSGRRPAISISHYHSLRLMLSLMVIISAPGCSVPFRHLSQTMTFPIVSSVSLLSPLSKHGEIISVQNRERGE